MALIILLFCYFGQAYSCVRTSSSGTTTLAPGVTAGTTLATGTTVTVPTTTATENLALTCKSEDVTLMVETGVPGSVPTGGPVVVQNMANTMTITCVAATTTRTQISFNDGTILLAPDAMAMETLVCNAMGKWTLGTGDVITNAACNDA